MSFRVSSWRRLRPGLGFAIDFLFVVLEPAKESTRGGKSNVGV